jgi:hypothetical protein
MIQKDCDASSAIFFPCYILMTNFCPNYFLANLNQMLPRSLLVGALSCVGLVAGLVPDLSLNSSNWVFSTAVYAQDFSNTQVTNYAKAVLEAEPLRQTALNDMKQAIGSGDVPQIVCDKQETFNSLPENARNVASNYCNEYGTIVRKYFNSFEQFNQITRNVQNDPNLKKRIQDEMVRLQNGSN